MSSRATAPTGLSQSSKSTSQRRIRSRSTSRYADLEKPKKKKTLSATTSLVSIPNTIKLSMLNSGLLSFDKFKLEARDENNSLSQTIPDTPIELRHFVKLCEQRRKFPVLYKLEFQTAIKVEISAYRHATRKNNLEKNQNQKCIPYDYNRVVLEKLDGATDSDYVNASYVDSLLKPNAYIVTQGPTEDTVLNFWRMIWQENVSAIIMLTKTFDFTKVMCVQYWPPSKDKDESYGDIFLGIAKEEQLANFHIRTFHVYKKDESGKIIEERELLQFHYTEWHSHTCPFSNAILEFRRRVRSVVGTIIKANSQVGPMLVHCNDGGGRSGVYLAIDANMELAEEEDCFHVYGYLKKLRQSRKGLIENVDQYKFVYDTLEENIICGNSWFPVSKLSERLKEKSVKEPITKMNEYQREYAQICKQTPRFSIGDCAGGHRADNREKNRDVLCVPPDNFRPYLTSFQGNAFTDYINAVFVDGYTRPREYIVTEWPLKQCLGEFWSLVYDQECSAVVVLCQPPHNSQQYPSFWPESKTPKKYGPVFTVSHRSHHHYTNIKTWLFEINKKIISLTELMAGVKAPSKNVQLFQLTCWPMGHKVPTSTNSLVALMNMVERWRQKSDYGPVCVVSPDGRSRSGVYCAANACIEQVIEHGEVDIFQAVKTVRRHRPQLVENITEYKYCYDLALHYVLHYLNKDLKEKKFIEFGRGKSIPLTPENSNSDLPKEISNAGRIVVKKRIAKIEKGESFNCSINDPTLGDGFGVGTSALATKRLVIDRNGKIIERKKKGRLYSLGGNDPPRKNHRGRLDRLKTVGTFDLGTEMCVLSEVARNLNEQLISGELKPNSCNLLDNSLTAIGDGGARASSPIPGVAADGKHEGRSSGLSTPSGGRRDISRSTGNFSNKSTSNTKLDQNKTKSVSVPAVKTQNSAEEYKINNSNHLSSNNNANSNNYNGKRRGNGRPQQKSRSLSTGSYLSCDRGMIIKVSKANLLAKDELPSSSGENADSNKIADDIRSFEDVTKDDTDDNFIESDRKFSNRGRKPQLRKSKRIVRSDSEFALDERDDDEGSGMKANEITLQGNTDIQIHNEPLMSESIESPTDQRIGSSDIDETQRDYMHKSTDESSRNISTDELDTVFSDSMDLEQLEKDYREQLKSNLQREYKSDGDGLDEAGRKRNEYGKWKNQSFDNDIDLFPEKPEVKVNGDKVIDVPSGSSSNGKDSIVSPRELLSNFGSPKDSENSFSQPSASLSKPRPSDLDVNSKPTTPKTASTSSASKHSSEGSISSLLEKRFSHFKKMNRLLKSKRFSTSILYEKKKPHQITRTEEVLQLPSHLMCDARYLRASPARSITSDSKNPIHSSRPSLSKPDSTKPIGGLTFLNRKSSIFSNASHSSTELNSHTTATSSAGGGGVAANRLNELSKSSNEINKFRMSPFRKSKKETKVSSAAFLNLATSHPRQVHSPLSEEFYNKTGSVRLSAMELFEKFCSEDFSGLYKHESGNLKTDEDGSPKTMAGHREYIQRMTTRGLGAIRKYTTPRNARLLKQKSEPQFQLHNDMLYSEDVKEVMYYHQEEDEEDIENDSRYYNENEDDEEGDYEEEVEEEEEEEEDDHEYESGDDDDEECQHEAIECFSTENQTTIREISTTLLVHDNNKFKLHQPADVGISTDSDVDEIYLMPAEHNPAQNIFQFNRNPDNQTRPPLVRVAGIDRSLNNINNTTHSSSYDIKEVAKYDSDEILTVYRICSKDVLAKMSVSVLNLSFEKSTSFDMKELTKSVPSFPSFDKDAAANSEDSKLERAVDAYLKNADDEPDYDELPPLDPHFTKFDCLDRVDSMELHSNSSETNRSGSTLTDYGFDTVRNVNLDSCSTSKLSLSLKSEVFEDFTLTPDEITSTRPLPSLPITAAATTTASIKNCDAEDFTLTPEGSISDDTINRLQEDAVEDEKIIIPHEGSKSSAVDDSSDGGGGEHTDEQSDQLHNVIKAVDDFITNERQDNVLTIIARKSSNIFTFENAIAPLHSHPPPSASISLSPAQRNTSIESQYTIIDLDDESSPLLDSDGEQIISAFTNQITKEFDLLFYRAAEEAADMKADESNIFEPPPRITSALLENDDGDGDNARRSGSDDESEAFLNRHHLKAPRIPTRYSMQKLEPIDIDNHQMLSTTTTTTASSTGGNNIASNKTEDGGEGGEDDESSITTITTTAETNCNKKNLCSRLSSNRSQSLGNLNKKTRCFPL